jgi:hypothetical protein
LISDTTGFLANLESIFKQNSEVIQQEHTSSKQLAKTTKHPNTFPHNSHNKSSPIKSKKPPQNQKQKPKQNHLKSLTQITSKFKGSPKKEKSSLILGGWDNSLFSGELHFHKVIRKSWWTLSLDRVLFNGVDSNLCDQDENQCQIIMDTGASLMATPPQMFNNFMSLVEPRQQCGDLSEYPRISFIIEGREYFIDPFEYVLSNKEDIDYKKTESKKDCVVGFVTFDLGPSERVWIAGDIFLSKYFSVYDRDNDMVGLALAN